MNVTSLEAPAIEPSQCGKCSYARWVAGQSVTCRGKTDPPLSQSRVVLSVFPGIDLLGMAFELEGFCVVRGPDILWGGDIRRFHPPAGVFAGVIGGPPCQDFSSLRRGPESGEGRKLIAEFLRVVTEAQPDWFLMENVPQVPAVNYLGRAAQRIDVRGTEVGLRQRRLRHFQFASRDAAPLVVARRDTPGERACVASEGKRSNRRGWADFCLLMGLPAPLHLPGLSVEARYRAVGNGVPIPMGRLLASAIRDRPGSEAIASVTLCKCGCGRPVEGKAQMARASCRKRMERRRRAVSPMFCDLV